LCCLVVIQLCSLIGRATGKPALQGSGALLSGLRRIHFVCAPLGLGTTKGPGRCRWQAFASHLKPTHTLKLPRRDKVALWPLFRSDGSNIMITMIFGFFASSWSNGFGQHFLCQNARPELWQLLSPDQQYLKHLLCCESVTFRR
jgi:hypothetical protein